MPDLRGAVNPVGGLSADLVVSVVLNPFTAPLLMRRILALSSATRNSARFRLI
jgi:hypothetical protein